MKQTGGFSRPLAFLLAASLLLLLVPLVTAHGGGAPQLINEPAGPYWLSVWTSPDPPQVGKPLHLTLGVAEPGTGREAGPPVLGATVIATLTPGQGSAAPVRVTATNANAANRLFYEADVVLAEPGEWAVRIDVDGPAGTGTTSFDLEAVEAGGPNWLLWGGSGVLAIAAFFLLAGPRRH
jgi:hypothetical protein